MSDKMREEFEVSCVSFRDDFGLPLPIVKDKKGEYISEMTARAWHFWQASRASLVVELPEVVDMYNEYTGDYCETYDCDEVKISITAAGVNYK